MFLICVDCVFDGSTDRRRVDTEGGGRVPVGSDVWRECTHRGVARPCRGEDRKAGLCVKGEDVRMGVYRRFHQLLGQNDSGGGQCPSTRHYLSRKFVGRHSIPGGR